MLAAINDVCYAELISVYVWLMQLRWPGAFTQYEDKFCLIIPVYIKQVNGAFCTGKPI